MLFGLSGVTSHWSGRHGTFDFTGEVRFAQWRDSNPDRSNLVSSMVCVNGDGSLDFDELEFGVSVVSSRLPSPPDRSNRVASRLACFFDRHSSLWPSFRGLSVLFGVACMTLHSSGRQGTFDFSGEVRFAQWRGSHSDRSNLVASMVFVKSSGSLDFGGLEFRVSVANSGLASLSGGSNRVASSLACFLICHSSLSPSSRSSQVLFHLAGVTSHWSGRHGTFGFTGEVRFAQ